MSHNPDLLAKEFRAFVADFAKLLTAEEIYQVAYTWLQNKTDTSIYDPSNEKKASPLKLFIALERFGIFSWTEELGGLLEIARSLKRYDLVPKVEGFIKKKGKSCGKRYTKKKKASPNYKEEREQFEQAYEKMVVKSIDFERQIRQLRMILRNPDLNLVDGLEVLRKSEVLARELAADLSGVSESMTRCSRKDSATSTSSDSSNDSSRRNSREVSPLLPVPETPQNIPRPAQETSPTPIKPPTMQENLPPPVPNQKKPIPKQRSQKSQSHHYPTPIQESKENTISGDLFSNRAELAHGSTSQLPPSPQVRGSTFSCPPSPLTVRTTAQLEDDCTGDSGMGTGSGNDQVDEWKRAMKKPPPVAEKPKVCRSRRRDTADEGAPETEDLYTPLRQGTMDRVHSYQKLKRGSPLS